MFVGRHEWSLGSPIHIKYPAIRIYTVFLHPSLGGYGDWSGWGYGVGFFSYVVFEYLHVPCMYFDTVGSQHPLRNGHFSTHRT